MSKKRTNINSLRPSSRTDGIYCQFKGRKGKERKGKEREGKGREGKGRKFEKFYAFKTHNDKKRNLKASFHAANPRVISL